MSMSDSGKPGTDDLRERADHHAREAERLLKGRLLSSHVKGQLHATLALYYAAKQGNREG